MPLFLRRTVSFSPTVIRTSQIPVIYVFGRKPIDVLHCITELANSIRDSPRASSAERLVLRCNVAYSHKAAEIAERLCATLNCPVDHREIPLKAEPLRQSGCGVAENQRLETTEKATEDVLLYVGFESLSLTNLLVTHGSSEVRVFLFVVVARMTEPWFQRYMLTTLSHDEQG